MIRWTLGIRMTSDGPPWPGEALTGFAGQLHRRPKMPPAKTERQRKFMGMCTTPKGRKKAKKKCPPVKVAREFARKGKKK